MKKTMFMHARPDCKLTGPVEGHSILCLARYCLLHDEISKLIGIFLACKNHVTVSYVEATVCPLNLCISNSVNLFVWALNFVLHGQGPVVQN